MFTFKRAVLIGAILGSAGAFLTGCLKSDLSSTYTPQFGESRSSCNGCAGPEPTPTSFEEPVSEEENLLLASLAEIDQVSQEWQELETTLDPLLRE